MTNRTLYASVCICAIMLSSGTAQADQRDDDIAIMKKQIEMLLTEVKQLKGITEDSDVLALEVQTLKEQQAQTQSESDLLTKQVSNLRTQSSISGSTVDNFALIEPAAGGVRGASFETTMNPAPKFNYGDFSWQPFGVLHMDAAFFDDDKFDHPDGAELRRARLGMKGTVAENVGYVVEADFGNSGSSLINAFVSYTGFDNGEIRFGHNRSPYSLEASTNTDDTTFIEFSAPTAAFDVGEVVGVGGHFHGDKWSAGLGLYNQNTALQDTDDEGWRVAGRLAVTPVKDEDSLVHIGASGAYVASRDQTNSFVFGATAENAIQTTNSVQATVANADSHTIAGVEAAVVHGPLSVQGEYFKVSVDANTAGTDADFDGGYLQASYFLTGERRPYVDGNGTFGRVIPNNDFISGKGWGAWELAARYSTLDLNDGTILGGEMDTYTLGVNWHLNQYTRMMVNYINTDVDASGFAAANDSPSLGLIRTQVLF